VPIPSTAQPLWDRLQQEIISLHVFWYISKELFGRGDQRKELFIKSGDSFFVLVQEALLDHIHLTLSKLSDPAASGNFENPTLARLLSALSPPSPLDGILNGFLTSLNSQGDLIRQRRNRVVAHFDLSTNVPGAATARPRPPLSSPGRTEIEGGISAATTFMNAARKTILSVPRRRTNCLLRCGTRISSSPY
jgi:AbiU2